MAAETPEDVAVLYSWANLHGAKYRDFSASRREYRAQLRHRAAEQVREQALLAQAEAEAAAAAADSAARHAADAARTHQAEDADSAMRRALREAEEAARTAAAERVEAARRAEAAAVAEAAARREEREIAEAHASAQRQAARYADSEVRRKYLHCTTSTTGFQARSTTSTPFTPPLHLRFILNRVLRPVEAERSPKLRNPESRQRPRQARIHNSTRSAHLRRLRQAARRPQGYHPDDASGVRQIYRGPDHNTLHSRIHIEQFGSPLRTLRDPRHVRASASARWTPQRDPSSRTTISQRHRKSGSAHGSTSRRSAKLRRSLL